MLIFKKEKEVRKLILGHLDEVRDCLQEARNAMQEYLAGDLGAAIGSAEKVVKIESKADQMELEIREVLLDGAFLPHVRSDVYRLVEAVDAIAGKAEDICHFVVDQSPAISSDLSGDFSGLYQMSLECFLELRKALKDYFRPKGKIESLHAHVSKVCALETEVDALESALAKRIFASDRELAEKIHLVQLITMIGEIADQSEDASDELEFAAMKLVV
jgi:predicted phosphate transport protein (TIGR00153 family)